MASGDGGSGGAGDEHIRGATDAELAGAPPFLGWTGVYLVVLGALAAQIAIYAALTAIYG